MSTLAKGLCIALIALQLSPPASANATSNFKGELKLQTLYLDTPADSLSAALGVGKHMDSRLNLRFMGDGQVGSGWSWDTAWVLSTRQGDGVKLDRRLYKYDPLLYTPADQRNWWDLRHTLTDKGDTYTTLYVDRLSLAYSSVHAVVRLGRQALTWGGGLVFHPMDLFNPFSPNAVNIEYKPGSDMLYGEWLFDSGADIQGVIVPRRDPMTGSVDSNQSAAGLKWHGFIGQMQQYGYELLFVRNYQADTLGVKLDGSLGASTWTAEVVPTKLPSNAVRTAWLANIQYGWTCFGRNCNGYAEYFYNGFGTENSGIALTDLSAPLTEQIAHGELFTVYRNYLALGVRLEWTPLLHIKPLLISNLDDNSALMLTQVVRSLSDNVNLTLAAQFGIGPRGTEFGGLKVADGSTIYMIPDRYLYARIDWYF